MTLKSLSRINRKNILSIFLPKLKFRHKILILSISSDKEYQKVILVSASSIKILISTFYYHFQSSRQSVLAAFYCLIEILAGRQFHHYFTSSFFENFILSENTNINHEYRSHFHQRFTSAFFVRKRIFGSILTSFKWSIIFRGMQLEQKCKLAQA